MNNKIRCKFQVQEITLGSYGDTLRATPVCGEGEENKKFWEATPSGSLDLNCARPGLLLEYLKPGQEFYLDLIPIAAEE